MKRRSSKGQSMVEYAIGIGAVSACCMVALGSLGHISGDMIHAVETAIKYTGGFSSDPGRTIDQTKTPWVLD